MKLNDDVFNSIDFSASNLNQVDFTSDNTADEMGVVDVAENTASGFQLKSDDNEGSGLRLKVDDSVEQETQTGVDNRRADEYGEVGLNENYIGTGTVKSTGDVYLDAQVDDMLNHYYNGTSPNEPTEKEINSTRMKGYFFFLLAALFIIFGLTILGKMISAKQMMENGEEMLATISKVEKQVHRGRRGHRSYTYKIYVSYTVNGLNYEDIYLESFWEPKSVGGSILVYYDPEKPYEVRTPQSIGAKNIIGFIMLEALGAMLFFFGLAYAKDPRKACIEGKRAYRASMRELTDGDMRRLRSWGGFWNPRNPWNRL